MNVATQRLTFSVNGATVTAHAQPITRLADVLRLELGLTGTKVGCNAGDCGACTILLDGEQVCACMVSAGQAAGREITTVEGLAEAGGRMSALQAAFHRNGAAQCGICTPGMLMAAADLLARTPEPTEEETLDALGGVLCRCTGYRKIVEAVLDVAAERPASVTPARNTAVGARLPKVDGVAKLDGTEAYGADQAPVDAFWLRAIRSPHASARFSLGDLEAFRSGHPGLAAVLTWRDVPGNNAYGIYPVGKDQPVLARDIVRYRGEAILALVGNLQTIESIREEDLPIDWRPDDGLIEMSDALAPGATPLHADIPDNILTRGFVKKGDVEAGFTDAAFTAAGTWQTGFVEHAYIEPEAGWARRIGDRLEVTVSTQTPYMDRDEIAHVMGLDKDAVRIIPTACGGGFGGKLDMSVHPLIALAAWKLERPVRMRVYSAPGKHGLVNQAPSVRDPGAGGLHKARGPADGLLFRRRLRHRRLCLLGADRGRPGAGPCDRPLLRAQCLEQAPGHPQQRHRPPAPSGASACPRSPWPKKRSTTSWPNQAGIDRLEFRLINAIRAGQATATGRC